MYNIIYKNIVYICNDKLYFSRLYPIYINVLFRIKHTMSGSSGTPRYRTVLQVFLSFTHSTSKTTPSSPNPCLFQFVGMALSIKPLKLNQHQTYITVIKFHNFTAPFHITSSLVFKFGTQPCRPRYFQKGRGIAAHTCVYVLCHFCGKEKIAAQSNREAFLRPDFEFSPCEGTTVAG